MDIDIQAVESKLSDVTVTPIPRSQVQNFYNVQQMQREQREQQPQIQISAIHHNPSTSSNKRDYHASSSSSSNSNNNNTVSAMAAAIQYSQQMQQLQAQLALLQQQSNTASTAAALSNSLSNSQLKYPALSGSPVLITTQTSSNITTPLTSTANLPTSSSSSGLSKYAQLLAIIEEMGRDIRPTYTGSRNSTERLKRGIVHARILVRECLMETERSARQ